VSCSRISIEEFARMMPVNPPVVKRKINPRAQIIGASYLTFDP
jgi:hypothetical protein